MTIQDITHLNNLQRSLGRRIRELRSDQGWTQEQFAEFCGLHRTYMGHVERGEKNVSLSTVLRVANALGVRISALFGRGKEPAPQAPAPAMPSLGGVRQGRADVSRLLDELQTQRKALRQAVRDLSRFLVQITDLVS
jgi:transcriptional regulator with XRE-family HTH domain